MTKHNILDLFDDVDSFEDDDFNQGEFYGSDEVLGSDVVIRAKWILDGADSLSEAADMARAFADYLDRLHEEGYILADPIEDDYGYARLQNS